VSVDCVQMVNEEVFLCGDDSGCVAFCSAHQDGPDTAASVAEQIGLSLEHGAQEAVPHHRGSARAEALDHVGRCVAILGRGGVRLQ